MVSKIDKGILIRDKVFAGNVYSQFALLMEGVKALDILRRNDSSAENILWAEMKMTELNVIYEEIQTLRE